MPGKKVRWMELALNYNEENNKILMKIGQHSPELKQYAEKIVTHYDSGEADLYIVSRQKLAALIFLTSQTYDKAGTKVAKQLGLIEESARKMLLETINVGPQEWLADEASFEDKGLIRGTSKYYVMHHEMDPESDFQKFRSQIAPAFLPILAGGVDCVCSAKAGFGLRIQPRVLSYVAAQLLPEGESKASVFEALKTRDNLSTGYNLAVPRSVLAIENISKALGIDVSGINLVTLPEQIKRPVKQIKTEMNEAADPKNAAPKELTLSRELSLLKHRGDITPAEEKTYEIIQRKKEEGRNPSTMEIQSLLTRGGSRISFSDAASFENRVEQSLKTLRVDITNNPLKFQPR